MAAGIRAAAPAGRIGGAPVSSLRRHLNLTRELAITQFKLKYTGSVLGYLWSLVKPLMLFSVTYVIFVYLFNVGRSSPHFELQLLLAIVIYTFFQEATSTAMGSVAGTGHLIRKAHFPRSILVFASTLSAFITFLINLTLIVLIGGALTATGFRTELDLGLRSLVAPLLIAELYILVLGLSLLLSALFVFYRDLGHIWDILTQVLLYASAVIYPFSLVSQGHRVLGKVIGLNPIAQIIEDMRHALIVGNEPFTAASHLGNGIAAPWMESFLGAPLFLVPLLVVVLAVAGGALTFRHLNPRFAENL